MTAAFIADGLSACDHVVYFEDGTADAVLGRLADDHLDGLPTLGRLEIVPTVATRAMLSGSTGSSRAGVRASIDEALAQGYRGWRMTGELSHGLRRAGGVGLVEYDTAVAVEIAGRPAKALCLYDRRRYSEAVLAQLRAVHEHELTVPAVYDDGLLRITRAGLGGARLSGEADHSNHGMLDRLLGLLLAEALRSPAAPATVTMNLSSLRFLDVAGAAVLVQAAERFPSSHRLVLRGPRPRVQRVLDHCGAPSVPQLDVVARPEPAPPLDVCTRPVPAASPPDAADRDRPAAGSQ